MDWATGDGQSDLDRDYEKEARKDTMLPVQLGIATENSTFFQVGGSLHQNLIRLVPSMAVDLEARNELVTFEPPPGYWDAVGLFDGSEGNDSSELQASSSVVVLKGPVGIGRRTAALALLARDNSTGEIRELLPDWSKPRADVLHAEPGGRYLLDLTYEEADLGDLFSKTLQEHAARLAKVGARMVITVTPDVWRSCEQQTANFTILLDIPDPINVVTKRLWARSSGHAIDEIKAIPQLANLLRDLIDNRRPPRRAVDLSEALSSPSQLDQESVDRIVAEYHHWKGFLDEQLGDVKDESDRQTYARQRALLIAASVLNGVAADIVFSASYALLDRIKASPPAGELLVGPELSGLLARIQADRAGDAVFLTTKHPGLDNAVLDRVWTERPQLRQDLLEWLADLTTERGLAYKCIDRVSWVLARIAVEHRALEVLDVVQRWLAEGRQHRRLSVSLLQELAQSRDIGSAVRRKLYEWANSKNVPVHVGTGVAEVCSGEFGVRYPEMALVRLRLLADSPIGEIRYAAFGAVRKLAKSSDLIRRAVVRQVFTWVVSDAYRQVGKSVSLSIFDPSGEDPVFDEILNDATSDAEIFARIRDGWLTLIDDRETRPKALEVAWRWLEQVDDGKSDSSAVIDVLAPAIRASINLDGVGPFLVRSPEKVSAAREALLLRLVRPHADDAVGHVLRQREPN
ncbi:hypothetical protein [Actinoplanes sp. L3-i22]|uniref:hypothetical protein n=1 Tax=Actinoplanes sp. L3-i22 TaxID=2836373 RepID=UPI001C8470A5|nr:hypothetical protein [Actinoplanes sp. L3-i22]